MQGQICDILRPQLAMNRFLPLLDTHSHTLDTYIWKGGQGALILERCRAFDLFASVDAHLCSYASIGKCPVHDLQEILLHVLDLLGHYM